MASYEHHRDQGTQPLLAENSILLQLVVDQFTDVFVVIDALDEYIEDGSRDELLAEIQKLKPKVHLLITSRLMPDVEHEFRSSTRLEIRAKDDDLRKHLHDRIQKTARLKSHVDTDPSLLDTIVSTIVEDSQGMCVSQSIFV